jgi:hypothetical protein
MAVNTRNSIVTNGLVLALDAGNTKSYTSGSATWRDISGNNTNGSLINGPTFDSNNGGTIVFDGVDDYISIGNIPSLNFTTPFSIGCWFRANTTQPSIDSALIGNINGVYTGYMLWYNNNTVDFYFNNAIRANSTTTILPNVWYHVMGVWTGTEAQIYLNGSLNVSTVYSTPPSNGSPLFTIGQYQGGRNFAGSINVCVTYNRALSQQEITQNYNAGKTRFGLA